LKVGFAGDGTEGGGADRRAVTERKRPQLAHSYPTVLPRQAQRRRRIKENRAIAAGAVICGIVSVITVPALATPAPSGQPQAGP
jgi:hypothetical protein